MRGFVIGVLGACAALLFFLNGFVQLYRLSDESRALSLEFFIFMFASIVAASLAIVRVLPGSEVSAGRRRLLWMAAAIGIGALGATGQPFVLAPTTLALAAALVDGPNGGPDLIVDAGVATVALWSSWLLFRLATG